VPIKPEDIGGDEDIARLVIMRARVIAPCIQSFNPESEDWKNAIAVLRLVVKGMPDADAQRLKSMQRNGTAMVFDLVAQAFAPMHVAALQSLCDAAPSTPGAPQGSFPESRELSALWTEGRYT
jgi:hypothetical protein